METAVETREFCTATAGFQTLVISTNKLIDAATDTEQKYEFVIVNFAVNGVAHEGYADSLFRNSRECYETDGEWKRYEAEVEARRKKWREKVIDSIPGLIDDIRVKS